MADAFVDETRMMAPQSRNQWTHWLCRRSPRDGRVGRWKPNALFSWCIPGIPQPNCSETPDVTATV